VESVAWITERKDVLSTFFALISLAVWLRYVRTRKRQWYVATWLTMAASLMAKQMLVTLPFVFLLLDYWPLRRMSPVADENGQDVRGGMALKNLVVEKLPFFVLTAIFCAAAFLTQSAAGATDLLPDLTLRDRLCNAVVVYVIYLRRVFWPNDLGIFYPHPGSELSAMRICFSAAILTAVSIVFILQRRRRPYLLVGWLWFLGTLVPVIGIIQVGQHQMADRFMYFPLVGLAIALSWVVPSRRSLGGGCSSGGSCLCPLLCRFGVRADAAMEKLRDDLPKWTQHHRQQLVFAGNAGGCHHDETTGRTTANR
jgi:hypothetical protein